MIQRRSFLSIGLAAIVSCRRKKSAGFEGYAFVANEEGQTVAVVDLLSFSLSRHISLPGRPTSIIGHQTRGVVYVLTPQTGTVHEIGTAKLSVERRARVAQEVTSMRLTPEGDALWLLCRRPRQLVRVDLDRFQPGPRISLPSDPVDFALSPNGRLCAVSFGEQGTVNISHLASGRAGRLIPIGQAVSKVGFRSDGRHLLIGNVGDRMISILEALTGRIVVHLPVAVRPENFCFKPDGGQLFVTGEGMDAVVVIYPYSTEVAATLLAGRAPGAMAVCSSPEREYLFIANPPSGDATVLDIETHHVIATVAVGEEPGYIAITPDGQYALVLNRRSGNMAVIRVAAVVPRRERWAPLFTMIPVGSKPVCAAVQAV